MRFRWDWLSRVVTVPYVPTLGPVHPDTLSLELFRDILAVSRTGRPLPYDKHRRWSDRKDDAVLVEEIVHEPDRTIIPTLSRRRGGTLRVHHHSAEPPDVPAELERTATMCVAQGAARGRLVWFERSGCRPSAGIRTQLFLKDLTTGLHHDSASGRARDLRSCSASVQATFAAFAQQLSDSGFGFLRTRLDARQIVGPVLVAVARGRVVGAIGPMATMPDRQGQTALLPQYFGVLPEHRGEGHGRALWRAAMHWGKNHNAAYQLLQAAVDSPAERLYTSEGLTTLGYACSEST